MKSSIKIICFTLLTNSVNIISRILERWINRTRYVGGYVATTLIVAEIVCLRKEEKRKKAQYWTARLSTRRNKRRDDRNVDRNTEATLNGRCYCWGWCFCFLTHVGGGGCWVEGSNRGQFRFSNVGKYLQLYIHIGR